MHLITRHHRKFFLLAFFLAFVSSVILADLNGLDEINSLYSETNQSMPTEDESNTLFAGEASEHIEFLELGKTNSKSATFQSHNVKIVENNLGLFAVYLIKTNIPRGKVKISAEQFRSTFRVVKIGQDNTVSEIFRATHATSTPPVLLTDTNNNLYLISVDHRVINKQYEHIYFYKLRWNAKNQSYESVLRTRFLSPLGQTGKFAAVIDNQRNRIYYTRKGRFYELDFSGKVQFQAELITKGKHAGPQYPHIILDRKRLYFAWTSASLVGFKDSGAANYYDIHFMYSDDYGRHWFGKSQIKTPLTADSNQAPPVVFADEKAKENNNWLANMHAYKQNLHFFYMAVRPSGQTHRYVSYRVRGKENRGEVIHNIDGLGEALINIHSPDGFFVSDESFLYLVAKTKDSRVVILQSDDVGGNWRVYALSEPIQTSNKIYALSGMPQLTRNGEIVGMFTERPSHHEPTGQITVQFFKVPVSRF